MMQIIKSNTLGNKFILLVLSIELFALIIWGSVTYITTKYELTNSINQQLKQIATTADTQVNNFFIPINTEIDVLTTTLNSELSSSKKLRTILINRLLKSRKEIEEISLIDKNGMELQRISRLYGYVDSDMRDLSNASTIVTALSGNRAVDIVRFSEYLEPYITIAVPILENEHTPNISAVLLKINLQWLRQQLEKRAITDSTQIYLVNDSMQLITHPDASLVLKGTDINNSNIPLELFSDDNNNGYLVYKNFKQHKVAGVSVYNTNFKWWVAAEQPAQDFLSPLARITNQFILVFLFVMSISIGLVVFFAASNFAPFRKLEHALNRITHDASNIRLDIADNNKEAIPLYNAFNKMASHLDKKSMELQYLAMRDQLTGLPNRKYLTQKIQQLLNSDEYHPPSFPLLLIDLNQFKAINDSLGHKIGDLLLKKLRPRLLSHLKPMDVLVRLNGDEFAILLISVNSIADVKKTAEKLRNEICKPFEIEDVKVQVGSSIGIALYPLHGQDDSALLRHADQALHKAKCDGTGIEIYDQKLDANTPKRIALTSALSQAMQDNQLILQYQPKIRLHDQSVVGVEALMRWEHPELGLLPPEQFIPKSQLNDLMDQLSLWVINRAILDSLLWQKNGQFISVAINIAAVNLHNKEFVSKAQELIKKHQIDPKYLQFEITESAIMYDTNRAKNSIKQLNQIGVGIAIDDYGIAYSSAAYLSSLAIQEIKIDKSFVMDMNNNANDEIVVKSAIELAHNLGVKVTAKGVESQATMDILSINHCDFAQGFQICPPINAERLRKWIIPVASTTTPKIKAG